MSRISSHDLIAPPKRRPGNPLWVKGHALSYQKLRAHAVRRFFNAAFKREFGRPLDELMAALVEKHYFEIIAELQVRADAGDASAKRVLAQKVLDLSTMREVRVLLKAPAKSGDKQAA
jgi:hypothetical protein